ALPLLVIVLFILFRSLAGVLVSLVSTVAGIVVSLGLVYLIAQHVDLSVFTVNAITMLGLGVSIDYSLFIVRRFQTELAGGRPPAEALGITKATAVRTVVASGATIAFAMSALFLVPLMIIRSIALGIIVVVIVALVVNGLLVPAILQLLGPRVNWLRIPARRRPQRSDTGAGGGSLNAPLSRAARLVLRAPGFLLVVGCGALAVAILPARDLSTFTPDARIVGAETAVRQGYDAIFDQFGGGLASPTRVLVRAEDGLARVDPEALVRLISDLERSEGVDSAATPWPILSLLDKANPLAAIGQLPASALPEDLQAALGAQLSRDGKAMLIDLRVDDWASSNEAIDMYREIEAVVEKTQIPGVSIAIGGETAFGVVPNQEISRSIPRVLGLMLVVIFLLLVAVFRSVIVPTIGVVFNLVSVGSTYGLMVLVFQRGWLADLFGFQTLGYIQNFVPVLLLALLIGLATDYQMFLLSRLREEFDHHGDTDAAVGRSLTVTASIITGAAILMIVVFAAFAITGIFPIQQLGFGLAIGVALDATIVRVFLVPSAIRLLGRRVWWPGRRSQEFARRSKPLDRRSKPFAPRARPLPQRAMPRTSQVSWRRG
ncbi:MAG: MMPL family transporter, partial [Propionibacteriaceae bacterium]|nr:MMPL family transporter [Propionibacteriaceae bacterium]